MKISSVEAHRMISGALRDAGGYLSVGQIMEATGLALTTVHMGVQAIQCRTTKRPIGFGRRMVKVYSLAGDSYQPGGDGPVTKTKTDHAALALTKARAGAGDPFAQLAWAN